MSKENDNKELSKEELKKFLNDPNLQKIIKEYEEACAKANKKIEFNIFRMLSDYYYRENFHGDIIATYLNPNGGHEEKDKFLKLFLEMILKDKQKISVYENNPQLKREYRIDGNRRIDFVIESGKNCIIIENKLYDAVDQDNQLPSYVQAMKNKGKKVDAVIYIPLSAGKAPDKSSWIEDEVSPLLHIIPAEMLIRDWLNQCIIHSEREDNKVILKHYKEMLSSLIPNQVKEDIMEELLKYLKGKDGELIKAIKISEMLKNMPAHMGASIFKKLNNEFSGNKPEVIKIYNAGWSECVVEVPTTRDVIYLQCELKENKAYKILMAVGGKFNISEEKEFEELVNDRVDLTSFGWERERQSGLKDALRLVKYFNFNQDNEVVDFLKDLIAKIL